LQLGLGDGLPPTPIFVFPLDQGKARAQPNSFLFLVLTPASSPFTLLAGIPHFLEGCRVIPCPMKPGRPKAERYCDKKIVEHAIGTFPLHNRNIHHIYWCCKTPFSPPYSFTPPIYIFILFKFLVAILLMTSFPHHEYSEWTADSELTTHSSQTSPQHRSRLHQTLLQSMSEC